jgi:hypothetical protein
MVPDGLSLTLIDVGVILNRTTLSWTKLSWESFCNNDVI